MPLTEILGWIGNIGFVIGCILLARKKHEGFYCNTVANGLYGAQAILMHNNSLLALSLLLAGINIYGVVQWKITGGKNASIQEGSESKEN